MKCLHQILRRLSHALAPCLGLCLALWSHAASAQVCTVTADPPVFGNYNASDVGTNTVGKVKVGCKLGPSVSYAVKLSLGGQPQGTQRRMISGTGYLSYNLFCDSGYSQIWADGGGGTCARPGSHSGSAVSPDTEHTVYGRIPGGQYVAAGSYTDTVVIEVLY